MSYTFWPFSHKRQTLSGPPQLTSNNLTIYTSTIKLHATFLFTSTHCGLSQVLSISMNTNISNDARLGLRSTKFTDLNTWPSYYSGHAAQRPPRSSVAAGWDRSWTSSQPASTKGGLVASSVPHTRQGESPQAGDPGRSASQRLPVLGAPRGTRAKRRRRRGRPSGLGLEPAGAQRARPGLGRLTLQSLRTNIMPWPGYMGPEQK